MAQFEYKQKKIHYETHGEGKPIILLNGIMMATLSWYPFIPALSANNKLILMDFLDQGQSDKYPDEKYNVELQVGVLNALLDHLGLEKAVIAGISYGGNVAFKYACDYPGRVEKLIIFNALAKSGGWLPELGKGWVKSAGDPEQFYYTTIPIIYSQEFFNARPEWMNTRRDFLTSRIFTNKEWMDAIIRLTLSMDDYDTEAQLHKITAKTLLIAGDCDGITPAYEQYKLRDKIKDCELVLLPGTGHATMYERPALFVSLITGFANAQLEGLVI
jgi:pimeloyl-ACP methyl ester carboxylesterase